MPVTGGAAVTRSDKRTFSSREIDGLSLSLSLATSRAESDVNIVKFLGRPPAGGRRRPVCPSPTATAACLRVVTGVLLVGTRAAASCFV